MGSQGSTHVRFGVFELNLRTRELRKRGIKIKLQHQPFAILEMLVVEMLEQCARVASRCAFAALRCATPHPKSPSSSLSYGASSRTYRRGIEPEQQRRCLPAASCWS
jgi:hypothetical protein